MLHLGFFPHKFAKAHYKRIKQINMKKKIFEKNGNYLGSPEFPGLL